MREAIINTICSKSSRRQCKHSNCEYQQSQPQTRAILREIASLQVNDEQAKVPEDSPFKGDYTGWCYASQRYIAARVGCSERWVRKCVERFEKDGVTEVREWVDSNGYPHTEYHHS